MACMSPFSEGSSIVRVAVQREHVVGVLVTVQRGHVVGVRVAVQRTSLEEMKGPLLLALLVGVGSLGRVHQFSCSYKANSINPTSIVNSSLRRQARARSVLLRARWNPKAVPGVLSRSTGQRRGYGKQACVGSRGVRISGVRQGVKPDPVSWGRATRAAGLLFFE